MGLGESPAGSATAAEHFLLIELPLPWPNKIEQHPIVAALPDDADGRPATRILGIRAGDDAEPARHRIISYRRETLEPDPSGAGSRHGSFIGHETEAEPGNLVSTLTTVITGDDRGLTPTQGAVDMLICTHGNRDRCCGQLGTVLHAELLGNVPDHVRLWRTSHTGGHRFAPTGISFPDGMTWAYLDAPTVKGVLDRTIAPNKLSAHNRGCAAVMGRPAQIADALAFERLGWDWLGTPRSIAVENTSTGYKVRLANDQHRLLASLAEADPVPVPACGEPLDRAEKSSPQFDLVEFIED